MNPFSASNKKPKEIQERINQASRDANELIENAKLCLDDPKFQQFKEGYTKVFVDLIQIMLELPREEDRIFSAQMDSIRTKIRLLQGFGVRIEDVANQAKRPIMSVITAETLAGGGK